jgi:hypothetical protein
LALSLSEIEALAPDQGALKAAAGLLKPANWPLRQTSGALIWGECQGSGANPYRVMADVDNLGSKCTCPSRKFPCKHALALMWMHSQDPGAFQLAETPEWVLDWMSRRRRGAATPAARSGEAKSLAAATAAEPAAEADPQAEARRAAAAARRAVDTRALVLAGLDDLELWIADQLRTGLSAFIDVAPDRCRRIAARLVDAKAGALASRLDEAPARLLALPSEDRIDAAIAELGKLTLAARAWRAQPDDPELSREVIASESREDVLAHADALTATATWEVLAERTATRRDGLVSVATWLLNLDGEGPRFALLLDFFPASAGRRSAAFTAGQRFRGELVFYPARVPLRAVIGQRTEVDAPERAWPPAPSADPLDVHAAALLAAPWRLETPVLLPAGRIAEDAAGRAWWLSPDLILPIDGRVPPFALGAEFEGAAGVWNGARLSLLAGQTNWGRFAFDA